MSSRSSTSSAPRKRDRFRRRATIAPIAVGPAVVASASSHVRRRTVGAAAVTGALMFAQVNTALAADLPLPDPTDEQGDTSPWLRPVDSLLPVAELVALRQAAEHAAAPQATTPFAEVDGLPLELPAADPVLVGFHESSAAHALHLEPVGTGPTAAESVVMPSRGRTGSASSAVDIAVPADAQVVAPVSGTIVSVSPYTLYGSTQDVRIDIIPDGRPDLRLFLVHVVDPLVEPGDRIDAGVTALAGGARQLPFASQIDRLTHALDGQTYPHVHLEARRGG